LAKDKREQNSSGLWPEYRQGAHSIGSEEASSTAWFSQGGRERERGGEAARGGKGKGDGGVWVRGAGRGIKGKGDGGDWVRVEGVDEWERSGQEWTV